MQTRSQALLEALQQVDDSVTGVENTISEAVSILEENNNSHARAVREAAEKHGESIENAASLLVGGLIVSSIAYAAGSILAMVLNTVAERARAEEQLIEMIHSILNLQKKYGAITYDFILERSYAPNSTTDERRTLLNGLIASGIVEDNYLNNKDLLFIDENSESFSAFWDWIAQLYDPEVKMIESSERKIHHNRLTKIHPRSRR